MFLDLDTTMLFGNETPKLGPLSQRNFTAKSPANNTQYIKAKHAHLSEQNFFAQQALLLANPMPITNVPNVWIATCATQVLAPAIWLKYFIKHGGQSRSQRHFGQAQGTQFTTITFTTQIDWAASTETSSKLILNGDFNSAKLSNLQALLLKHCCSPYLDSLSLYIMPAEFISKFKRWDENMSTSPLGLHLGHYKALVLRNDADLDTEEGKALDEKRNDLICAHVAMINYSLKHSYSFKQWKNVVNVMIKKEPGKSKVHRLRVIHIYEADHNFLLQA
jgi:hypothetical protein